MSGCVGVEAVVFFDGVEVGVDVVGGVEDAVDADEAFGVVDVGEQDGDAGLVGDAQEAGVPVVVAAACAFGCDGDDELVAGVELLGDLGGDVGVVAAVDGYASESAHEVSYGEDEPGFFHEEFCFDSYGA